MTIPDTDNIPNSGNPVVKEGMPVMPCQTAEGGGSSGRLARGSTPSTPDGNNRRKPKESRRMTVLKFFRCTPEEDIVIRANAADTGMRQSFYMRNQCIGKSKARKVRRIRADWDELRRCMGIINKAGNVVNQLVKFLYLGGKLSDVANTALEELRKAARAVREALDRG